jgi:hypothetical protein
VHGVNGSVLSLLYKLSKLPQHINGPDSSQADAGVAASVEHVLQLLLILAL